LINIGKAKYSFSGAQLFYDLVVGTPLYTCDYRLTCINILQDRYLPAVNRIQMFKDISVDVRLQYFMPTALL